MLGVATSDRRLKENIKPLTNNLTKVLKLKPYRFNLIEDSTKTKQIGLMAQDILPIIPEVVFSYKDKDDTLRYGIDYSKLVPVLVGAIQRLERFHEQDVKRTEELEHRIEVLEAKK